MERPHEDGLENGWSFPPPRPKTHPIIARLDPRGTIRYSFSIAHAAFVICLCSVAFVPVYVAVICSVMLASFDGLLAYAFDRSGPVRYGPGSRRWLYRALICVNGLGIICVTVCMAALNAL